MELTANTNVPLHSQNSLLAYTRVFRRNHTPAWVYAITLFPSFAIVALFALQPWVPLYQLVGDPLSLVEDCLENAATLAFAKDCERPYFGLLSNLGNLVWCGSAAVCLFVAFQVYSRTKNFGSSVFLLYAGILTSALMMDDMFQGHEKVYPFFIGLNEKVLSGIYAVLAVFYLAAFRKYILRTDAQILFLSIGLLALSILMDQITLIDGLFEWNGVLHRVAEDGSKFMGIWAWAGFHIRAAWLTSELPETSQATAT